MKAVLFDLDGTLIEYERSPGEVLEASFRRVGVEPLFPVEDYYDRFEEFATRTDTMAGLRSECFAALAEKHGHHPSIGRRVAEAFDQERDQTNVTVLPGVPEVLDTLQSSHRLGLVTNGTKKAQEAKIHSVNLDAWMDCIVVAGRRLPPKPSPEPIEHALRELNVEASHAIFVGDSLEHDVGAARTAGVRSVWVSGGNDPQEHRPDYCLETIADLMPPPWEAESD